MPPIKQCYLASILPIFVSFKLTVLWDFFFPDRDYLPLNDPTTSMK